MKTEKEEQLIGKAEIEQIKKEAYRPTVWLKTYAETLKKLEENKMISKEEAGQGREIHRSASLRYLEGELL